MWFFHNPGLLGINARNLLYIKPYNPKRAIVLADSKIKTKNLVLSFNTFKKVYDKAGESALIDLTVVEEKPVKVLVQDVQYDPTKDTIIHVDFHQIRMDEKITTNVPIQIVGEASAVKELGGTMITTLDEIEIECLPGDLIHEIEVDISKLKTFDDMIHVKDLKVPDNIKILKEDDEVVISVMAPRTDEEIQAMEEEAKAAAETPTEGEEVEAGKEEAEASAEGEEGVEEAKADSENKDPSAGSGQGEKK